MRPLHCPAPAESGGSSHSLYSGSDARSSSHGFDPAGRYLGKRVLPGRHRGAGRTRSPRTQAGRIDLRPDQKMAMRATKMSRDRVQQDQRRRRPGRIGRVLCHQRCPDQSPARSVSGWFRDARRLYPGRLHPVGPVGPVPAGPTRTDCGRLHPPRAAPWMVRGGSSPDKGRPRSFLAGKLLGLALCSGEPLRLLRAALRRRGEPTALKAGGHRPTRTRFGGRGVWSPRDLDSRF